MLTLFAKFAATISLMLTVSVATPAWPAGKHHNQANCPYAKAKLAQTQRLAATNPPRSVMIIDHRKQDVQILSFGP